MQCFLLHQIGTVEFVRKLCGFCLPVVNYYNYNVTVISYPYICFSLLFNLLSQKKKVKPLFMCFLLLLVSSMDTLEKGVVFVWGLCCCSVLLHVNYPCFLSCLCESIKTKLEFSSIFTGI